MARQKPLEIELPPLHPTQRKVRDSKARFRVLACGRRWGKSRLASALATEAALLGGSVWIVAPVYASGNPIFDDVRRLAAQIPTTRLNRAERRIDYPGGGFCQVKTADDPALLRGTALDFVAFDEAAFMPRLQEIWLEVIRPALADRKGRALFCSTPSGQNYFWQLFQYGQDDTLPDWASWQMPTGENPYIEASEIEHARRQMTERAFAQEFLAEFTEAGSVFRNVRDLATAKPQTGPQDGHSYTVGIDWGRSGDYTVLCVYDATDAKVAFLDRFSGQEFSIQLGRVTAAIETWRPRTTVVELNSFGQAMFEQLQRRGLSTHLIGFTTTNANKGQLVDCLALALERREITLLDDPVLVGELQAFQSDTTPTGLTRYSAPDGGHDDTVIALMLAYGPNAESAPGELQIGETVQVPNLFWYGPSGDDSPQGDPRARHGAPGHRKWAMRNECPQCFAEFYQESIEQ